MTSNRERFEEWYLAEFWEGSEAGLEYLAKEPCGGYTHVKPQELWKAWQAAQPAAGEPVAMQARMPGCRWENYHKDDKSELIAAGMEIRWLYASPPASAHGELMAVVGTVPDGSGFKSLEFKVALESLPDGTKLFAMRAQAGEGGE